MAMLNKQMIDKFYQPQIFIDHKSSSVQDR
jgi:hypothetical protein